MSLDALETTKADLQLYLQDLRLRSDVNAKQEILFNIGPLLQSLVDASISDSVEQWGALTELIETTEDVIHIELATKIAGTLEMGNAICQILRAENVTLADEIKNKRLQDAILTYMRSTQIVIDRVAEVTIGDDEESEQDANADDEAEEERAQKTSPAKVLEVSKGTSGESSADADNAKQ